MPIIGHFVAYKSGHRLNNLLLRELMGRPQSWELLVDDHQRRDHRFEELKIPSFSILDAAQA